MSKGWESFFHDLDTAIEKCLDDGIESRLQLATSKRVISIDVYPTGGTMKKMDDLVLKTVKEKTGIDLLKVGK